MKAVNVTDIEPRRIMGGTMLWHPVRRTLGVRSFGTNAYTALKAGDRVVEEHTRGRRQARGGLPGARTARRRSSSATSTVEVGAGGWCSSATLT